MKFTTETKARGKNGAMRQTGIEAYNFDGNIELRAITSRGVVSDSAILRVPTEDVGKFVKQIGAGLREIPAEDSKFEKWKSGENSMPGSFCEFLYKAACKADNENFSRLVAAFPEQFLNLKTK